MNRAERKALKKRTRELEQRTSITVREMAMLAVVTLSAGLAIYTAQDKTSALGLLTDEALADSLTVVTTFRPEVLTSASALAVDIPTITNDSEQVGATVVDPNALPQVTDLQAENTRIGDEVALFWTLPEGVEAANVYRLADGGKTEELVAAAVVGTEYIDTDVISGTEYIYRVQAVSATEEAPLNSAPLASVTPLDTIAPAPPANLVVTVQAQKRGYELVVEWDTPIDSDVVRVALFRSDTAGVLGTEIAERTLEDAQEYIDTTVAAGQTYYYAVVAYDSSGNASSQFTQVPTPGNTDPFSIIIPDSL